MNDQKVLLVGEHETLSTMHEEKMSQKPLDIKREQVIGIPSSKYCFKVAASD